MSRRAEWRSAVQAASFPVGMRPVKATLLSLPVDVDGLLAVSREAIADATGLPVRTVNRHLARAVEVGWLIRVTVGGNGRRARYAVCTPESCRPEMARNWPSCRPPGTRNSDEVAGHVVARSIRDGASVREHLAVDDRRQSKTTTDVDRVSPADHQTKDRSDERAATSRSPLAAVSPLRPRRSAS